MQFSSLQLALDAVYKLRHCNIEGVTYDASLAFRTCEYCIRNGMLSKEEIYDLCPSWEKEEERMKGEGSERDNGRRNRRKRSGRSRFIASSFTPVPSLSMSCNSPFSSPTPPIGSFVYLIPPHYTIHQPIEASHMSFQHHFFPLQSTLPHGIYSNQLNNYYSMNIQPSESPVSPSSSSTTSSISTSIYECIAPSTSNTVVRSTISTSPSPIPMSASPCNQTTQSQYIYNMNRNSNSPQSISRSNNIYYNNHNPY
jgi:hypothetical protein